ncbi:glycosyltransferase involved in cell wall biosynthesis [Sinomonas atrocyanea]|jgi:glycosyltransferase involved in cell wall biosynthesis|nr:glycosyltransferase involved in cell wall biosynthesis [Sinomonas atrocyanea]
MVQASFLGGSTDNRIYSPGYAGILTAAKQVLTVHDLIHLDIPEVSELHKAYYQWFLKPLIIKNGIVITVSKTSERRIKSWLGRSSVSVVDCGNGVSEEFCLDGEVSRLENPYFLYVGSLKPHKQFHLVLEAMRSLPGFSLVVAGPGLRDFVSSRYSDLTSRVVDVSGSSDETLARYYRGAVATVLPSSLEGFGLPAVESMACGTPVVYFAGCESVAEICNGDGYSFTSLSAAALRRELKTAAADGLRVSLPGSSYRWSDVASKVSEVLGGVC